MKILFPQAIKVTMSHPQEQTPPSVCKNQMQRLVLGNKGFWKVERQTLFSMFSSCSPATKIRRTWKTHPALPQPPGTKRALKEQHRLLPSPEGLLQCPSAVGSGSHSGWVSAACCWAVASSLCLRGHSWQIPLSLQLSYLTAWSETNP